MYTSDVAFKSSWYIDVLGESHQSLDRIMLRCYYSGVVLCTVTVYTVRDTPLQLADVRQWADLAFVANHGGCCNYGIFQVRDGLVTINIANDDAEVRCVIPTKACATAFMQIADRLEHEYMGFRPLTTVDDVGFRPLTTVDDVVTHHN